MTIKQILALLLAIAIAVAFVVIAIVRPIIRGRNQASIYVVENFYEKE